MRKYLQYIAATLSSNTPFPTLSEEELEGLLIFAEEQSIYGIIFEGLTRAHEQYDIKCPQGLLFNAISVSEQISLQNIISNKRVLEIIGRFAEAGYRSCILKGQGNALMYKNPLSRTSGDIDIWVEGSREDIVDYVRSFVPNAYECYHHIEFPVFNDVAVEVHFTPTMLFNPYSNRKIQKFFKEQRSIQMEHKVAFDDKGNYICVPEQVFNAVFQMAHLKYHFFIEGVGLRQFIDYYYLLLQGFSDDEKYLVVNRVRQFGMLKFSKGVMWILNSELWIDKKYLLIEPDGKVGRFMLNEILEGGNFGHHDKRYETRKKGYLARGIVDTIRLLKLARVFPTDAWWKIVNKIGNQKWRIRHKFLAFG